MSKKEYLYITFHNTLDAMTAENLYKTHQIPGRLVAIPSELSAGCGMAWRSEPKEQSHIEEVSNQAQLSLNQIAIL